jgi:hypothetical protein
VHDKRLRRALIVHDNTMNPSQPFDERGDTMRIKPDNKNTNHQIKLPERYSSTITVLKRQQQPVECDKNSSSPIVDRIDSDPAAFPDKNLLFPQYKVLPAVFRSLSPVIDGHLYNFET